MALVLLNQDHLMGMQQEDTKFLDKTRELADAVVSGTTSSRDAIIAFGELKMAELDAGRLTVIRSEADRIIADALYEANPGLKERARALSERLGMSGGGEGSCWLPENEE